MIFASIFSDSLHLIGTVFVAAVAANLGIVRQTALADSMRQGAGKGDGLLRLWPRNFAGRRFRSLHQHLPRLPQNDFVMGGIRSLVGVAELGTCVCVCVCVSATFDVRNLWYLSLSFAKDE